jgi:hypothetical protein
MPPQNLKRALESQHWKDYNAKRTKLTLGAELQLQLEETQRQLFNYG